MARQFVRANVDNLQALSLAVTTAFPVTIACWIYPGSVTATQWIAQCGLNTNYVGLVIVNSGIIRAQANGGAGSQQAASPSSTLVLNTWQHICGVFRSSGSAQQIYYNGSSVGTNATAVAWPGSGQVFLGRNISGTVSAYEGRIAEFGGWNVELTVPEIQALAKGVPPIRVRPQNLSVYFPIWGFASPEPNLGFYGSSATLVGSPAYANHAPVGAPVVVR